MKELHSATNASSDQTALLEAQLDDFSLQRRKGALQALCPQPVRLPNPTNEINIHAHTFFSYNYRGYSPTHFAWLARRRGLAVAGIVDFDVLDGLDEFFEAGQWLGLKTTVGLESRVYVPEFSRRVINSPGEPGISYHMGVGFTTTALPEKASRFLKGMRDTAQRRNRELLSRVNEYLKPVVLDFDRDVLPLTPNGNATERHLCLAFAHRAAKQFPNEKALAEFWQDKLHVSAELLDLPNGIKLQGLIRAKTMKMGGVGYVRPDAGSFPRMAQMNEFVWEAGAIPTLAWLDGTTEGEKCIDELIYVAMQSGVAAINIIPDRNYTPNIRDSKLQNLYDVVAWAQKNALLVAVGTEMNTPGQKFVDNFASQELQPLVPVFLQGAHAIYAHTVLQRQSSFGFMSRWAQEKLPSRSDRIDFFAKVGSLVTPQTEYKLRNLSQSVTCAEILARLQ